MHVWSLTMTHYNNATDQELIRQMLHAKLWYGRDVYFVAADGACNSISNKSDTLSWVVTYIVHFFIYIFEEMDTASHPAIKHKQLEIKADFC